MLSDSEKRARLEKALRLGGNTHTVEDVAARIEAGQAQLWENGDGAIVTEVYEHPRRKVVSYWLACGALDAVLALQEDIDGWARGIGCDFATLTGRRGWAPILPKHGWRLDGLQYVKDWAP